MNSNKRGFTLVELMVVIAMIALIIAAMSSAVSSAKERAKFAKATAEVKSIHQAILAYENYMRDKNYELPTLSDAKADKSALGFLLGDGASSSSGQIPTLLLASLSGGETMRDPWGRPYLIKIQQGKAIAINSANGNMKTGFDIPNRYRLTKEERQ